MKAVKQNFNITSKEHFLKYHNLISDYGLKNFIMKKIRLNPELLGLNPFSEYNENSYIFEQLKKAYDNDRHLNSIDLRYWDNFGELYLSGYPLTLSERVCFLKHIAIYDILQLKPQFKK